MFFKLFNWLLKKGVPYALVVAIFDLSMAVLAATFGAFLILGRADFKATGTEKVFIFAPLILVTIFVSFIFLKHGLLRIFGLKLEGKIHKILNDNIINGHIPSNISDQNLLQVYNSLERLKKSMLKDFIGCVSSIVVGWALIEWMVSGYQLRNVFIILAGGFIASSIRIIFGIAFLDLLTYPARKECKMLLAARNKYFKETHFITLKTKSKFFIILTALTLGTILLLVQPLTPILIIFSIVTLLITGLLISLVFESIYKALIEIKESAKDLVEKKKASFFSGSSDKEIIDLSQNLNKTAKEITNYQQALEEEKASLQIKVKARTKELAELTQSLEEKVKERTKELEKSKEEIQEKAKELEKWYNLTVGRELRMIELKKEIKELEEELEKKESA